ncbi:hypothetical protein BDK51DRAFT_42498 [Blyttiomyces helicus]|uniref:Uncharacterized protein n=1 Tax=Blyttiomyces helicus TaxID=388810 RepID=A0A4P9WJU3_9FUNG|nr:hypothetical protein BDK51DRAFT_42498 [Blyttiomyces helicus]|eukprot:RKO92652.1 hypothetical protein BDK51DRAFT_42498 [Blyttiomyces helicus]
MLIPQFIAFSLLLASPSCAFSAHPGVCTSSSFDLASVVANGNMGLESTGDRYNLLFPQNSNITTYTTGVPIDIILSGPGTFAGVLVYAAAVVDAPAHTGSWSAASLYGGTYQVLDRWCGSYGNGTTLGHTSATPKALPVTFQWIPTAATTGPVMFFGMIATGSSIGFQPIGLGTYLPGGHPPLMSAFLGAFGSAPVPFALVTSLTPSRPFCFLQDSSTVHSGSLSPNSSGESNVMRGRGGSLGASGRRKSIRRIFPVKSRADASVICNQRDAFT